jgi:hypothetical protein
VRRRRSLTAAREIKRRHEDALLALEGVQGVGLDERDGSPLIKVYVDVDRPSRRAGIPAVLEDVPVEIEESGLFEAL